VKRPTLCQGSGQRASSSHVSKTLKSIWISSGGDSENRERYVLLLVVIRYLERINPSRMLQR
jgi:hypothetical protein